ncbi:grass carp reovirus (GCRV)-induced gene 2e [Ictalurus punctatus]|uniref:Grass carp reovirus (GCRV)-induced gene 2e n=1 Tax=Ictalurus punctatus TaxID=7998 RepID=A0A9F7TSF1_ICTPU|nr:grass carp reovirus (GCRV)-induced gene 2e [Ictalurus punctatus]
MWAEDDLSPGFPSLESFSVPADGKVYRMYHGTSIQAADQIMRTGFKQSAGGMLGRGVYLSRDLNKASRYPLDLPEHQRVVIRVKVNVGRVKKIDHQGHPLQKTWHDHGYDTAWCPPRCGMVPSGLEEDCVWDPSRIQTINIILPSLESFSEPADGKVYRMYHGTSIQAAAQIMLNGFRQSADGMLGRGVYLSRDLNKASRYPLDLLEHQRVVIRVRVNVGRVKKIDHQGHRMQKTWHDYGYDTAWCPPGCGMVRSGLEEDCVWDSARVEVIDIIRPQITFPVYTSVNIIMWAEDDLGPGVPCLQSFSVPADGKVYRMYHGTSQYAAAQIMRNGFKQSEVGMLGRGVYLSRDLNKASRYPLGLPEHQRVVIRVRVNVGRVKKIDHQGHRMQKTWHDYGYDTAWCPPGCGMVRSGLEEDCVWDPARVEVIDIILPCLQSFSVPADGKVYRMYHGTSQYAAAQIMRNGFKQSEVGMLGRGVYLSRDLNKASRYPLLLPEHQRVVIRVRVNVGRVKKIDHQGHPLQKTWHDHGYDTAWCPPRCGMVPSGLEEDCVWDPRRIQVIDVICPRATP